MNPLADILLPDPAAFRERLRRSLAESGAAIFPDLLRPELAAEARAEMERIRAEDGFRPAAIGRGEDARRVAEVRGDGTRWFEPDALSPTQAKLGAFFDFVRATLNEDLFLGLWDWEGHYAIYPPGAFYRKHVDRFRDDSKRAVSMVLFFNPDWSAADGGRLRLELAEGSTEVEPRAGTAVFFLSERIPHEVLETRRDRFSFAGWFRTRA